MWSDLAHKTGGASAEKCGNETRLTHCTPWSHTLHDHEPTEDKTMVAFPDAGHHAKQERDKKRQVGNYDHSRDHRERDSGDKTSGMPAFLC
jgi:hypothetical protein